MGKKNGTSWLTIVKRAFRSPTKENEKKSSRRREEHEQEEEEKKREKRRWLFRRPNSDHAKPCEAKPVANATTTTAATPVIPILAADQRHAIAVAAATAAAAEAAVVTAQAAVEIARLTRPSNYVKEHYAAVVIQTAFRGYLARRALRALKGLVMLQALVRGQNVRKQTKFTLKCIQAVVRAQDRVRDQRARLSHELSRKSMVAEINSLWESANLQDIKNRKSISKSASGTLDDWDDRPHSSQGIDGTFQSRKEAGLKREKALAYAFSNQMWKSRRNPSAGDESDLEERTKWLDRWMATKQWDNSTTSRASTDSRDLIKTVEIDMSRPCSYSAPTLQKSQSQNHQQKQARPHSVASPLHRAQQSFSLHQSPVTPSPRKTKPLQVRSASPRYLKEDISYSAAVTPNLRSTYCINNGISRYATATSRAAATSTVPNYMAATQCAKARARSQSAPRQRSSTSQKERGGSVKKRLSYPAHELHCGVGTACNASSQNLGSISFKSLHGGYYGMEQLSNYSSYTESFGGEISPSLSGSRFSLNLWE
ncbi:protein IQ-DOMAIN 1-like [Pistacia vera]|uniref:protein IQ-DOMAIN 1-like n=1 Tax=Pistacia vera TaxID=55513 RepID=UPI001263C3A9|nr:protein IQ-DOMAIN 1-like [Pistacia vera]